MKKILFISRLYYPHVGGVEKHVRELCNILVQRKYEPYLITGLHSNKIKSYEKVESIEVVRITYPEIRFFGLIVIWIRICKLAPFINKFELIHIHDVYVWYFPLRVLFPEKKVFLTNHGWEGKYPITAKDKLFKKFFTKLSQGSISVGKFINKYYGIDADYITYGAIKKIRKKIKYSKEKAIVYVGRLSNDTGLTKMLVALEDFTSSDITFLGDGELRDKCEKVGHVVGFVNNVEDYLVDHKICMTSGYLAIFEAFRSKCLVVTTFDNQLKKDYLLMTPFKDWIVVEKDPRKLAEKIEYYLDHPEKAKPMIDAAYEWVQGQTWEKMADTYEELWGVKKSKV